MPVHWQVATVTLAVFFPFAAVGLWMLASWGPVIWVHLRGDRDGDVFRSSRTSSATGCSVVVQPPRRGALLRDLPRCSSIGSTAGQSGIYGGQLSAVGAPATPKALG